MKKILRTVISICLVMAMFVTTAFAVTEDIPEWQDIELTEEEFNAILANNVIYTTAENSRASDLINLWALAISKEGNTLYIAGRTVGTSEVVRSGFKEVVIQRRTSSSASWTDYITYEDLYIDEVAYNLGKSLTVPTGYQYRVTCIHYAKKNILSTQKIDNVSNTLTF